MVFALCSSQTEGIKNCKIQYSKDPSYSNLSIPVTGPIGSPFPVCFVDGTLSVYYHQASVIINSTLEIIVRPNGVFTFATDSTTSSEKEDTTVPDHALVLEVYQMGLIGLLIAVLALALAICTGVVIVLNRRGKIFGVESDMIS